MDVTLDQEPSGQDEILSLVLKAIRRRRGYRSSEVARLMGMAHRSYQRFEAGELGFDLAKVHRFADAVHADAWGIIFAVELKSVEFALHCIDNQAAKALVSSLRRFNLKAGKDIARLDTRSLFIVFTKAFDQISARAREYDADLEQWMFDGTLNGASGEEADLDDEGDEPDDDQA